MRTWFEATSVVLPEAAFEADVDGLPSLLLDDDAHRHAAGRADRRPVVVAQRYFFVVGGAGIAVQVRLRTRGAWR
jgi:hypothetical protein